MTEQNLSEQDVADLKSIGIDPETGDVLEQDERAEQHSLLRIWSEVLSNVEAVAAQPLSMGVAGKIVASWPTISFQETPKYHELYHDLLLDIRTLLTGVIEDHPGAADIMEKEDISENYELYKQLIIDWNLRLDELEQQWRAEDLESHIMYAALVDVRGTLFGRDGLAGHLEARGFELSSDEVIHALRTARGEQ